jgi:hypothetical protein
MSRQKIKLLLIICLAVQLTKAQTQATDSLNDLLEFRMTTIDTEPEITIIADIEKDEPTSKPALNTASRDMLYGLKVLTKKQITALLQHRKNFGPILYFEELQILPYFDSLTIAKLRQVAQLGSSSYVKEKPEHNLMLRYKQEIERPIGYKKDYLGSPARLFVRFRGKSKSFRYGLNAEKDPGEPFLRKTNPEGFDFYTGFIQWQSASTRSSIVLGDFTAGLGQHLTFSNGMALRKSAYVLSILPSERQLQPSASSNESNFLRGLAFQHSIGQRWKLLLLASSKAIDAKISHTDNKQAYITSFPSTGLHRTQNEANQKRKAGETTTAMAITHKWKQLSIGAVVCDRQVQPRGQLKPDKWLKSIRKQTPKVGLFTRGNYQNLLFFGEISRDTSNRIAHVAGVIFTPDKQLAFGWVNRNYPPHFDSKLSRAFSERSTTDNEKGNYFSLLLSPNRHFRFRLASDLYHYPHPTYRADLPIHGNDHLMEVQYTRRKKWSITVRHQIDVKSQNKEINQQKTNRLVPVATKKTRLEFLRHLSSSLRYKARLVRKTHQYALYPVRKGLLLFQDFSLKPKYNTWTLTWRLTTFDTPDYETRIYAYEHDVLYAFSIPAYYGRGKRFYIIWKQKWTVYLSSWLRYSITHYTDRNIIGSGLDAISGATKSDVTLQLRLSF